MSLVVPPDPLTVPTWLTAIFTGALALFALVTAGFAIAAFSKQSAELKLLKEQSDDQRETNNKLAIAAELQAEELKASTEQRAGQAQESRREQARLIAAVVGPQEQSDTGRPILGRTAVDLVNSSPEPVYRIVVAIVAIQGTVPSTIERWLELDHPRPITTASILPPGTHRVWIQGTGWTQVLSGRPGAEVAFTDRSGGHWIRRATGQLEELPADPITHFLKYGPHELQTPERVP